MVELAFEPTVKWTVRLLIQAGGGARRRLNMDRAENTIQGAGASSQLLADFRALADATAPDGGSRYATRPTLNRLARFIVGRAGGPNRDTPLYELCHLVTAIDACGNDPDRRALFFLGGERITPSYCASAIDEALADGGWSGEGIERTKEGVSIDLSDGAFTVSFGRMPFLVALYEFLCGMEEYAFYGDIQDILERMTEEGPAGVREASNAIARQMRQYRNRHLRFSSQNGRFELIYRFLQERTPGERLRIDDEGVLDFWLRHSGGDDFRGYRTVFRAFVSFMQALDDVARGTAAEGALSIGTDREEGEIDPEQGNDNLATYGDWRSPFAVLDAEPAARIKFFKKRGERDEIEQMMEFGPRATKLPLAYLRLECFGPVQSAITNDLQVKRGAASVRRRIACEDSETYAARCGVFESSLTYIRELQKATLHALHGGVKSSGNVVTLAAPEPVTLFDRALERNDLPDIDSARSTEIFEEAARAFRRLTRKGFDEASLADENHVEGFRVGAGAVLEIAAQLESFLQSASRLDQACPGLAAKYDQDRSLFREQFAKLYGGAL